jgi:3-oxoacyl-[acyl-carrier-protein] synthase II
LGTVITGVGAIAASAGSYSEFRELLFTDDAVPCPGREIRIENHDPAVVLGRRGLTHLDACTKMALCAAAEALAEARIADAGNGSIDRHRIATVTSCNLGVLETVYRAAKTIRGVGSRELHPVDLPNASPNVAASHVAIRNRLKGPNLTVANGFSSGLDALLQAKLLLGAGRADVVLLLGVESLSDPVAHMLRAAPAAFGVAETALGEGAAALVMEREEHAKKRGAHVRARLLGSGQRQGGGEGDARTLAAALKASLASASLAPDQIDLILSAECGCERLRETEAEGFEIVFGRGGPARRTALKSRVGESYGAMGVFQAVAAVACLETQEIFPSPAAWSDGTGFDKVAPLVQERLPVSLERTLGVVWDPGSLCTAVILGRG